MNYYTDAIKKYIVFEGRASRKEYWMFILFSIIISIVLAIVDKVIDFKILSALYSLFILLPSFAILSRRLHDTNRSAWWILIGLIPFIGVVILLIFTLLESDPNSNIYGPNTNSAPMDTTTTPAQ